MKKDKVLSPIKRMQQDVKNGDSKHKAFARYLSAGGQPEPGSMALAMIPDKAAVKQYGWMNILILLMYWLPVGSLYAVGAFMQGNFYLGHLLVPMIVTYFVLKKSAISYYFFIYLSAKVIYEAFNSSSDNNLFLSLVTVYCTVLIVFTIKTKLTLFSYQSFFQQKKKPDGTFVFTSEPK
ncbi:hypothetical protein CXF72_09465 [Psychromonas sp. MB-3u-54]|uniref:hypothetical protein n=1 Tax=Psychromonas sp. MB-3u-54 TaxID=2058319 RepID=UPI000C330667|nr:hypothetical protein [Psychromonas sp. MB-3u-54]PKH02868.1 hypothetical protein CXF72_09465 [Psychromonas sp. MB-3u-54]